MPLKPCIRCGVLGKASYCARHAPKVKEGWRARPSPSSKNRPSPAQTERIRRRDGRRCQRCGTRGTKANPLHVHHRKRVADGGQHDEEGMETLCSDCHKREHRRSRRRRSVL